MKSAEQKAKKVPAIRFAGFDDEWVENTLGSLMEVTSVKRIHQSDWTDSGVRFLRARDIVAKAKNEIITEPLFISQEKYEEYSLLSGKVHPGDMLVTGVGTIGVPMMIDDDKPLYFKDGNIIWFKNEHIIDDRFLYHAFNSESIQIFIKESAGIGTVGTYTIDCGKKTPISLPLQRNEQRKIGSFFSNIDSLISLEQKKYDKLTQVKKSMLEKMFPKEGMTVPEIRFANFTGEWEKKKLGDMGTTYTGLSGKTKSDFGHGMGRFVTYMNVFLNPVCDPNRTEAVEIDNTQNTVRHGDVFFTTSSETPEEVGMSSVWLDKTENIYLNSFCFGYRPTENIDPFYLAYMLRSNVVRKKITYLAQGISRYNISKNGVMEIEVPLPNFKEQQKIGSYFSHLDSLISLQQRKLEKLKNIKKSLLEKMFV